MKLQGLSGFGVFLCQYIIYKENFDFLLKHTSFYSAIRYNKHELNVQSLAQSKGPFMGE